MYKAIICFDLDGTLLDPQEKIRQPDKDILTQNQDYLFVPATGRSLESVKRLFKLNQLFEDQKFPFPLVTLNGGIGIAPQEDTMIEYLFSDQEKEQIFSVFKGNPNISFLVQSATDNYLIWPNQFSLSCLHRYKLRYETEDKMPQNFDFVKVMCFCDEADQMSRFVSSVEGLSIEMAFGTPFIFEFTPLGVNKGSTLVALTQKMKLSHLPIFAAGDGGNDLETFRIAKRSFAPKGSLQFVLDAADELIEPDGKGLLPQIIERSLSLAW
jgi:Cof subfamily protein (haloacid dehalogenase superfamily)